MYIREVITKNKENGSNYSNFRLVKNVRIDGNPKQVNLLSMGQLNDLSKTELSNLANRIDDLYYHKNILFSTTYPKKIEELAHFFTQKLIQKNFTQKENSNSDMQENAHTEQFEEIDINSITGKSSEQIGGEFLCKQAVEQLGIDDFLKTELNYTESQLNNCLIALTGRLLFSSNECQTERWLNDNSGIQEFYPLESGKVNKNQLYSAANLLYKDKDKIQKYLNKKIETICNFKRKIVLYDLTNTHFEGIMNGSEKATFGHNKQKRYDCRQITLGMLTDEFGFPIHTAYYPGNISEPKTFEKILNELSEIEKNQQTNEKPCVIIDAGIAVESNIKLLLKKGYEYICVSRSSHSDLIDQVVESEIVKFKNKSEKELSAQLFTQKFKYEDINNKECEIEENIIYIKSPDKEKKEHAIDEKKYERFENGLKEIEKTIQNVRGQRSIAKINQRLGRLKEKNRGIVGFFEIDLKDDTKNIISISWKRKTEIPKEKKQGVYFLRTNISGENEEKLWNTYRLLNEVEEAFGTLKSELKVRPNFHQSDATIEAHINLCVLAYYVVNFIRYRLKLKDITLCWNEIRRIMSTQKRCLQVSRTKSKNALWTKFCTRPIPEADKIYKALDYKNIPFYRKNIKI